MKRPTGDPQPDRAGKPEEERLGDEIGEGQRRLAGGNALADDDEKALQHAEHAERHDQRRDAHDGDTDAVEKAEERAGGDAGKDGKRDAGILAPA